MPRPPSIPDDLWATFPAAAQAIITALTDEIAALKAEVASLHERLGQNSTNSNRPPSSDPPHAKPAPPRTPSGRKRGGQPGHPKHERILLPADEVVDHKPTHCDRCRHPVAGDDPDPIIEQVIDLPVKLRHVIHHRLHTLTCPHCHAETTAPTVPAAATGFGPAVQAATAYLTGGCRIGTRPTRQLLQDVFGIPMSLGTVTNLEHRTSTALGPIHAAAHEYTKTQDANLDETTWYEGRKPSAPPAESSPPLGSPDPASPTGSPPPPKAHDPRRATASNGRKKKAWLWVAVAPAVVVFLIRGCRNRAAFDDLRGGATTIHTTDRYVVYDHLAPTRRQLCWAHLCRDFQAMIDRKNAGSEIGEELLLHARILFDHWERVRDGTITRGTFRRNYLPGLRDEVHALLARGRTCGCPKTAAVCADLWATADALWTFARRSTVEPTNNAAERERRHAVCWRKTSYGTDSARGSRYVERILTVIASCRRQKRNILAFLTAAIVADRNGTTRPSLVPVAA
jgi:transposase